MSKFSLYLPDDSNIHLRDGRMVADFDDVHLSMVHEQTKGNTMLTNKRKRTKITPQLLGEIGDIIAKNPRITRAQIAKLTGLAEITVKTNKSIKGFFEAAKRISEEDARGRYSNKNK